MNVHWANKRIVDTSMDHFQRQRQVERHRSRAVEAAKLWGNDNPITQSLARLAEGAATKHAALSELEETHTVWSNMNLNRPVNAPSRGLPGFQAQSQQVRAAQMPGGSRMQISRMGPNQPQWGYGAQAPGGGSGLQNSQARAPGLGTSFAQTIGGNQSSTPLDPSEFPSLSGVSQPQIQNHNQAFWSGQRQHTPVQRPQPSQEGNQQSTGQEHGQQSLEDAFFPSATSGSLDDYRYGSQNGVGQLPSSSQPQPSSIDDFPPLGGNGPGEIGQDRRVNMMQSAASGAFGGSPGFPPGIGNPRAPGEALRNNLRPQQNGNDNSLFSSMNESVAQRPIGRGQPNIEGNNQGTNQTQGTPAGEESGSNPQRSPSQMTDADKYGLPGLLDNIRNENNENFNLAIGHDLTALGLDLNSSEPLYPSFGGPFANRPARPLEPDFTLPPCYTVTNVPPVNEKLPHFSDETLFLIFYTYCGDVLQELAAIELTLRNWRFHKTGGFWMTKEQGFEPTPISPEAERGHYIVFDQALWARKSHEMTLRYAELDDHITSAPANSLPLPP